MRRVWQSYLNQSSTQPDTEFLRHGRVFCLFFLREVFVFPALGYCSQMESKSSTCLSLPLLFSALGVANTR